MDFNKTDKELEKMSEDELFAYLDAKSAHLKKQAIPLDQYHMKRYASMTKGRELSTKELREAKRLGKEGEFVKNEKIKEAAKNIKTKKPDLYVKHHKTDRSQWFE